MKAAVWTACLALALSASPTLAQTPEGGSAVEASRRIANTAAAAAGEERECRTIRATGSRVGRGRRMCLTATEWADQARRSREATNTITRDSRGMGPQRGG